MQHSDTQFIRFRCPQCQKAINAKAGLAGKRAKCPGCGTPVVIPGTDAATASEPAVVESMPVQSRMVQLTSLCEKSRDTHWFQPWRTRIRVGDQIDHAQRAKCRETLKIPESDAVIAIIDTGIFPGWSHGFAITDVGIYWQGSRLQLWKQLRYPIRSLTWDELAAVPIQYEKGAFNPNRNDIVFGNNATRFFVGKDPTSEPLYELLLQLQELVRYGTMESMPSRAIRLQGTEKWFYAEKGEKRGPIDAEKLREAVRQGRLTGSDLVWREGLDDWVKVAAVGGLLGDDSTKPTGVAPQWADIDQDVEPPATYTRYDGFYCSSDEKLYQGLCAGLAHRYGIPVIVVRAIVGGLVLSSGFLVGLAYGSAAAALPKVPTKGVPRGGKRLNTPPQ